LIYILLNAGMPHYPDHTLTSLCLYCSNRLDEDKSSLVKVYFDFCGQDFISQRLFVKS